MGKGDFPGKAVLTAFVDEELKKFEGTISTCTIERFCEKHEINDASEIRDAVLTLSKIVEEKSIQSEILEESESMLEFYVDSATMALHSRTMSVFAQALGIPDSTSGLEYALLPWSNNTYYCLNAEDLEKVTYPSCELSRTARRFNGLTLQG